MKLEVFPIGVLRTPFKESAPFQAGQNDDSFGSNRLILFPEYQDALYKLESFNYIYVLFYLHLVKKEVKLFANPPSLLGKNKVGLFASRSPNRPSPIGLSIVKLLKIEENILYISEIDALDKTPVVDIKPYFNKLDCKTDANSGWVNQFNT